MEMRNFRLKDKIHILFIHYVNPLNVLPVVKKHNPGVLIQKEEGHIRAETYNRGKEHGAEQMLDYMVRYEDWFPCLLAALEDRDVNLLHIAKQMKALEDELDLKMNAELMASHVPRDPQNGYELGDGGAGSAAPVSDPLGEDGYVDVDVDWPMDKNGNKCPEGAASASDTDGYECIPANRPGDSSPTMTPTQEAAVTASTRPQLFNPPPVQARSQRSTRHGDRTEYDFSREETERELSTFPGWHANIAEASVKEIFKDYFDSDGHFILWYWAEMKRPALSITYRGGLKNFVVHKKPSKTNASVVKYYYIYKDQHRDSTISRVVQHHLEGHLDCRSTQDAREHHIVQAREPIAVTI